MKKHIIAPTFILGIVCMFTACNETKPPVTLPTPTPFVSASVETGSQIETSDVTNTSDDTDAYGSSPTEQTSAEPSSAEQSLGEIAQSEIRELSLTEKILSERGKCFSNVYELANKYFESDCHAPYYIVDQGALIEYVDMDSDGIEEKVEFSWVEGNMNYIIDYELNIYENTASSESEPNYILSDSYCGEGDYLYKCLTFLSLDGEHIVILVYEDGPSHDPLTTIYKYEDNKITLIGEIESDLLRYEYPDGVFEVLVSTYILMADHIKVKFELDYDNSSINFLPQDEYYFYSYEYYDGVKLNRDFYFYEAPDEKSKTFIIQPQSIKFVKFKRVESNIDIWFLLEAEDGTTGWFYCDDYDTYVNGSEYYFNEIFDNTLCYD